MNVKTDLKGFYVGDRKGIAIYVGSTQIWPICTPIEFADPIFEKAVAKQYLGNENTNITNCNNPVVNSWYVDPQASNPKTSIFRVTSIAGFQANLKHQ